MPSLDWFTKSQESWFLGLVAGEVPRLRDDAGGYGPKGRGFIASVDVPTEVERSWEVLRSCIDGVDGLR